MQTNLRAVLSDDPALASSQKAIRSCVHCGFCLSTCPTYLLRGDERDSPRGRIYLIKEMLEGGGVPSSETVKHIDRCLSCLACATTCPSGVDYMHLVDQARSYISRKYKRPIAERVLRKFLSISLSNSVLFRVLLHMSRPVQRVARWLPKPLRAMLALAPKKIPRSDISARPGTFPASCDQRGRVLLLAGCVQPALAPTIHAATIRLLTRLGFEVIIAAGAGCCGSLPLHLGEEQRSRAMAKANIRAWAHYLDKSSNISAIVITASGCGTTIKDYGFLLRDDADWSAAADSVSKLAVDVSEFLARLPKGVIQAGHASPLRVGYHSACSLQHGQRVTAEPISLLHDAGFIVVEPREKHLCCGSAGTYNILQPEIAAALQQRKVAALEAVEPDVIATGNIGCLTQIGRGTIIPALHLVELLDWATGGPKPPALAEPPKA